MLRFDPNLRWLFTEYPMLDRYEMAANVGFKGVEVAFPYEYPANEIAARLDANGLKMVQILSPFDWDKGERGIAALPGRESDFKKSIHTAVEYAVQIGGPLIHVMPGNLKKDQNRNEFMDVFLENIAWAADFAKGADINLILEPCCQARFSDFFYHTLAEGVAAIELIGRDNVKLCFDTFHIQTEEGSISEKLISNWPHIGHIQVGNVPGRNEPGCGEINFPYIFNILIEKKWGGWIGCEYTPSVNTMDSLGWGKSYGLTVPEGAAINYSKAIVC